MIMFSFIKTFKRKKRTRKVIRLYNQRRMNQLPSLNIKYLLATEALKEMK